MPARSNCRKPRIFRSLASASIESLESRTLLNATVTSSIGTVTSTENASATAIDLTQYFKDPTITGTAVVMHTSQGDIPLNLFNSQTPQTVANFRSYADTGAYNDTVIHRAISGFLVQGGTYLPDQSLIHVGSPVPSEAGISNTVGTIAAALFSGGPGTATSGWFINDGNNSTSLDGSGNGGPFTVFGQVVYSGVNRGMSVVNQIANLPKGIVQPTFTPDTANLGDPPTGVLPLQNYDGGTITPANYVTITSVQEVPSGLTFSATSSNTSLVVPTIDNGTGTLSLSYQPNQTGIAKITVDATDLGNKMVSQTFEVAVGSVLGTGGARQIRFTDADGTRTTLALTGPGAANVSFNGTGITESLSKAGVLTVSGSGLSIAAVSLTGTSAGSTLNVTGAGGNGLVEIGSITSDGNLRTINATRGALSGNLTIGGTVSRVALNSATGGTIAISGTGGAAALAIPTATGEAVASSQAIASVQSSSWVAASGGASAQFSAPSITRFAVTHELNADLVSGNVGTVTGGSITASTWSLTGALTGLSAGSITGLDLTAASIGRITDRGAATNDNVSSAGNITAIAAQTFSGTRIDAGDPTLDANGLATAFPTPASIRTVTVGRGGFTNSTINAASFGNVTLGPISSSNGGTPFGVGTHQITLLTATVDGKRLTLRNPASESDVTAAESKAGITPNDLVIRII
jgi:cyclophilin family peptidyl-prolyl cis-trans isomerase